MKNFNKQNQDELGRKTEINIAKTFRSFGYWSHIIVKNPSGQPCDVMAAKGLDVKNKIEVIVWLVDAKHVENKVSFSFDRIEPNQITSLGYARDYANIRGVRGFTGFVIFFERDKELRWLSFDNYEKLAKEGVKSVNMADLRFFKEVLADANSY